MKGALFFFALLVGAGLRFYALGDLPHGIYHDEAYYGLDAVSVLAGARPIFFPANNGREPLYIYLLSLSLAVFGRTPFGLRFASALLGTLTIPVTYLLGRALFNQRIGLLAMWGCAISFWPVALSRISFRAGALPLFLGLALALGWLAVQRRSVRLALLSGAAYGLAFNTYTAARITPPALLIIGGVWLYRRVREARRENENVSAIPARSAVKILLTFLIAAGLLAAPLAGYAFAHPDQVFAREGQVSIFETESGNPLLSLLKHLGLALGMFGFWGDSIARHNLPGRPVFDGWTFLFFLIGLTVLIRNSRRAINSAFVLIWLAVTLLPTVFAQDTPHFLRSIAMLPVLWLVPAVGLEAFISWGQSQLSRDSAGVPRPCRCAPAQGQGERGIGKTAPAIAAGLLITASAFLTIYDYFSRYIQLPTPPQSAAVRVTNYYFESAATDLAAEINDRSAYAARIDYRLWDNFASLRFLIPNRAGADSQDHVVLAMWPYEPDEIKAAVLALPPGSLISAKRGEEFRGDLEPTAYSLYTLYVAEPVTNESVTARFGESVQLRGTRVEAQADGLHIRLGWSVSSPVAVDYHVFVHVFANGELIAQSDGEPLSGLYHFSWLKPGDVLNDEYALPKGDSILVGVYAPDGAPLGEPVILK